MPEPEGICGFRGGGKYSLSPASGPGEPKSLRFRARVHVGHSPGTARRDSLAGHAAEDDAMRPRSPAEDADEDLFRSRPAEDADEDLFRSRLANMLDPRHELLRLAAL